jgi:hypothetical protein
MAFVGELKRGSQGLRTRSLPDQAELERTPHPNRGAS